MTTHREPSPPLTQSAPESPRVSLQGLSRGERRVVGRHTPTLEAIAALEPALRELTDEELAGTTSRLRVRLAGGETLKALLPEAYAAVREAARRVLGMRHYDVQMLGGIVLFEGCVAEMGTGEGKTLVATLPAYLASLEGLGAHIVTVNDYLAKRDAEWVGKVFTALGSSVGVVVATDDTPTAQAAFAADITYVTAQQLGFTYLRDNMTGDPASLVLTRPPAFALVDEVDAVLVDECATPLVMSAQADVVDAGHWVAAAAVARRLRPATLSSAEAEDARLQEWADGAADAVILPHSRQATLTGRGLRTAVSLLVEAGVAGVGRDAGGALHHRPGQLPVSFQPAPPLTLRSVASVPDALRRAGLVDVDAGDEGVAARTAPVLMWGSEEAFGKYIQTCLKALHLYHRDVDYTVRDDQVILIDQSTGREREKTRWSDGLHQAVEAKERAAISARDYNQASITFTSLFKMYRRLAGMTGTALPLQADFLDAYDLKVVALPPHRPRQREDHPPEVYMGTEGYLARLEQLLVEALDAGRPVLVGTATVEQSEALYGRLSRLLESEFGGLGVKGPTLNLLNARPESVRREAQIIAQAGLPGTGLAAWIPRPPLEGLSPVFHSMQAMRAGLPAPVYVALETALREVGAAPGSGGLAPAAATDWLSGLLEEVEVLRSHLLLAQTGGSGPNGGDGAAEGEVLAAALRLLAGEADWTPEVAPNEAPDAPAAARPALRAAALLLWLWFDGRCREQNLRVRAAGGLRVLIASVAPTRSEAQLRGRAGRQGDPGDSFYLSHLGDRMLEMYLGSTLSSAVTRLGDESLLYEQQPTGRMLVGGVQQRYDHDVRMRLQQERKRDAVVDPYRRHVYSIRRALLEADAEGLGVFTRGYCADFVRDAMRAFGIEARGSPGGGEWDLEGLLAAIQGAVNGDPSPSLADQQARFHDAENEGRLDPRTGLYRVALNLFPHDLVESLKLALQGNQELPFPLDAGVPLTRSIRQRAAQAAQLPTAPPESDADRLHAWLLTQLIMAQHAHRALCQRALARFLGASREEAEEASLLALRAAALACIDSLWADFLKNMETLAAAAMVRAFSRRDPWDEFKLETSALFMLLLQDFRQQLVVASFHTLDLGGIPVPAESTGATLHGYSEKSNDTVPDQALQPS
ncbi:Protein translocase subunit SecA [Auxenochlorella protothecoides]|uniref:chloroplast protein-transporting ATPase n=1 Tax=Auxenochlorella protothecoides TaxID=3075 RepID=A0A087SIN7_AUXPR|nr:Protein translocase subunit SecA [Auxenochlorella protothecoides]KFM25591.1 Protein translocase subunit SecA [Auxenochlorella protothecoides]